MSGVLQVMCHTLRIKHLKTSVYHAQTNGLMECLNGTIKRMLQQCIQGDLQTVGFTAPFNIVCCPRHPTGLIKVLTI